MSLVFWERQKKLTMSSNFLMIIFSTTKYANFQPITGWYHQIFVFSRKNLNSTKNKKGNVSKKLKHQSNQEAKRNISKSVIGMKVLRLRPSARVKANEDLESIGTFYSPPKISWNRSRDSDFKRKIPIHALWSLNLWGTLWIFEGFCGG